MPSQASKRKLVDVREQRHSPRKIEMRDDPRTGDLILEGYASTFDEYDVYGGPENYGWIEKIDRGAFAETLRQSPDLHLLINHDGMPLARTKSGTLSLSVDDVGLKVSARLDRTDPDVQSLIPKMARGDMDEMSFAFRVKNQTWSAAQGFEDDPMSYRTITELSLQRGDVSVVNFGANPNTSVALATVGALGALADSDLSELRGQVDRRTLVAAAEVLAKLTGRTEVGGPLADLDAALAEAVDLIGSFSRDDTDADVLAVFDQISSAQELVARLLEEDRKKGDDDDDDDDDEDDDDDDDDRGENDADRSDEAARRMKARRAKRIDAATRKLVDDDRLNELGDALGEASDAIAEFDRAAFDPDAVRVFDLTTQAHEIVSDMLGVDLGTPDDGSEALGARALRSPMRQRYTPQARRKATKPVRRTEKRQPRPVRPQTARSSAIADGLRIEVGGTKGRPTVRLHDASGLLDQGLCTRITAELREALLGNRGQIVKGAPASQADDTISAREAAQLTGGETENIAALKAHLGQDPRATVSLKEARQLAQNA